MPPYRIETHGAAGTILDDVGEMFADARRSRLCALTMLADLVSLAPKADDQYTL